MSLAKYDYATQLYNEFFFFPQAHLAFQMKIKKRNLHKMLNFDSTAFLWYFHLIATSQALLI